MIAYFVHDEKKDQDQLVLPEVDLLVAVNRRVVNDFISVKPDFSQWSGSPANGLKPESFGRIIATRSEEGDVCVVEQSLWHQRMNHHLSAA